MLAVILLSRPDIMLLDEPTNHLDTESLEWLESWLKDYPGTIVTIAHDRVFLDKIVTVIAELANRTDHDLQGELLLLPPREGAPPRGPQKGDGTPAGGDQADQGVRRAVPLQGHQGQPGPEPAQELEKFDVLQEEGAGKTVTIRFPESPRSGKEVLTVRGLAKSYGDLNVFHDVNFTLYRGEKAAVVGVNGAGKSTLSRILSGDEAPTAGEVVYGPQREDGLLLPGERPEPRTTSGRSGRRSTPRGPGATTRRGGTSSGAFLFSGDDVYKEISVLSGGEKSRLALLKILLTDTNLLILDEPTNHLDLKTREIFQNALLGYQGTILIVSHDRYFLDCLVDRVFETQGRHLSRVPRQLLLLHRKETGGAIGCPVPQGPLARAAGSPGSRIRPPVGAGRRSARRKRSQPENRRSGAGRPRRKDASRRKSGTGSRGRHRP